MTTWHDYYKENGHAPDWPYTIKYDQEQVIETDVLVIGGGIAGCWAAISAARTGVSVAMVEKGDTVRSGAGGPGCDHWCDVPANPLSKVSPDEWAVMMVKDKPIYNTGRYPYNNGISRQIQCRENYDTLLEMEQMGGKIRDTDDEYVGAEGRDEKTKFMISPRSNPDHSTNVVIRIWGTTFKPVLKKECKRLGVRIFDRVMATGLLTDGGIQGNRVIGATAFSNRTGEFLIFKAKAIVLATAQNYSQYIFNTELSGYTTFRSRNASGDGAVMAWKAGAELTLMEGGRVLNLGTGFKHTWYSGAGDASYENVQLVDADGKELPWPNQGWRTGGGFGPTPEVREAIRKGIFKGEWALPFYGDFPAMPEIERRATWEMMLGQEATTKIITDTYGKAGFDPARHLLQGYQHLEGVSLPQWRMTDGGGPVIDWDLKTTLDGLYAAGDMFFSHGDHSHAAATGRYAGRKAAAHTRQVSQGELSPEQVAREKTRIYAPIKRSSGIEWKELHAGIARAMQYYVSEFKTEKLLQMGLDTLNRIEERHVPNLYALDPHKLMRSLEDLSLLTFGQIVIQASLARKASSRGLDFNRIDYPQIDPPEWNKFITLKLDNNKVKVGELPLEYWGNMKEQYEAHNRDYAGVYKR